MYDVIVVGAGPAGSIAAKKCAELGLNTLLLERKALPRDKVCSGMVMGLMAQGIIEEEFGPIPDEVLTTPRYLLGCMVHVPGVKPELVEQKMPLAWRRELDFWMTQKARQAGVEVRDRAKVASLEQRGKRCLVRLEGEELEARFVIGADGARSTIRKLMYPRLEVTYRTVYRECYGGELALDRNYYHWFFPLTRPHPRFDVSYKENLFLLEGATLRDLRSEVLQFLHPYGFSEEQKPLWKDGCLVSVFHEEMLATGHFIPARENILVVGDAALLQIPVSGEGIGIALKSGLLAAHSVAEAMASKRDVVGIYIRRLEPLLNILKELYPWDKRIKEESRRGPNALLSAFAEGLRATLRVT